MAEEPAVMEMTVELVAVELVMTEPGVAFEPMEMPVVLEPVLEAVTDGERALAGVDADVEPTGPDGSRSLSENFSPPGLNTLL